MADNELTSVRVKLDGDWVSAPFHTAKSSLLVALYGVDRVKFIAKNYIKLDDILHLVLTGRGEMAIGRVIRQYHWIWR